MRALWERGAVDLDTFVWCDGMDDFRQVRDVPGLERVFAASVLAIPEPPAAAPAAPAAAPAAPAAAPASALATIMRRHDLTTRGGSSAAADPARGSLEDRFERLVALDGGDALGGALGDSDLDDDDDDDAVLTVLPATATTTETRATTSRPPAASRSVGMDRLTRAYEATRDELSGMRAQHAKLRADLKRERDAHSARLAEAVERAESRLAAAARKTELVKAEAREAREAAARERRELEAAAARHERVAADAEDSSRRRAECERREDAVSEREAEIAAAGRELERRVLDTERLEARLADERRRLDARASELDAEYRRARETRAAIRDEERAAASDLRLRAAAVEDAEARLEADVRTFESERDDQRARLAEETNRATALAEAAERHRETTLDALERERERLATERDAVRAALGEEFRRAEAARREDIEAAKRAAARQAGMGAAVRSPGRGEERSGGARRPPPPPLEAALSAVTAAIPEATLVPVYRGGTREEGGVRVGDVALTRDVTVGSLRETLAERFGGGDARAFAMRRNGAVVDASHDTRAAADVFGGYEDAVVVD